ncbi:hypothetical protein NBRC116594_28070 [Shimia sp. NS0008-38b]|uniref:hypothetical protein n=1 Tax=Shimia sp. NS0008-38b TaxID=3127653 RepID=UPI0031028E26
MKETNFLYVTTALATCLAMMVGGYFLARTAQPSADVLAAMEEATPSINVGDFEPGEVRVLRLGNLPIIVWRRDEADMALANRQNDASSWKVKYSSVLGRAEPLYAEDANLTLNGEWFFAVAHAPGSPGWVPLLRAGNFDGFFDVKYAGHYDLAGRIRYQGRDNLTVVLAELSEDGQTIQLDLRQ